MDNKTNQLTDNNLFQEIEKHLKETLKKYLCFQSLLMYKQTTYPNKMDFPELVIQKSFFR